tara:strand:+ start:84 stop:530 length:447 start_codon:yes stop_codon:yes gene_type:complete
MKNRSEIERQQDEDFFMYSYEDFKRRALKSGNPPGAYEEFRSNMCGAMISDEFDSWRGENLSYYYKVIREVRPILDKLFIKTLKDNGEIDAFIDQWNSLDADNIWSLNEIVSAHEPEDLVYYIACNSSPEEVLELFHLVMNYIGDEEK